MRNILTLAYKDLRILTRDRYALFWVAAFPMLIAVLFGAMFGGGDDDGGRRMQVALVDEDGGEGARFFCQALESSSALQVTRIPRDEAFSAVRRGKLTACIVIKKGFSDTVPFFGGNPHYEVGIDPARKAEAAYLQGLLYQATFKGLSDRFSEPGRMREYFSGSIAQVQQAKDLRPEQRASIVRVIQASQDFFATTGKELLSDRGSQLIAPLPTVPVVPDGKMPTSGFQVSFPQAMLWALIGCVTTFAVSLVRERTEGTLLRLRVSPLRIWQILAGKAASCAAACITVAVLILIIGHFAFGIAVSNPAALALAIGSSAACFTGIMMLMSVLGRTPQAVGGSSSGITILMSMFGGGMIPLFIMPGWMQTASNFSPAKWAVLALEGALWRAFTFGEMLLPCLILVSVGICAFSLGTVLFARLER